MITDPTMLEELISTTEDLIEHDHVSVALTRSEWERVPGGGTRPKNPTPQEAKDRFFGAVTTDPRYVTLSEGEQVISNHVLIGLPGDDIKEKDTFKIGSRTFLVVEVEPDTSYQVKGWVIERS